ncbi:MAG: substrate-binding domain-containing protein [Candidatus Cloacimonetes bacterium]|nr:substrate-binding domain-containing protein [Candidatus Cloacimonadota bacterium]
MREVFLIFMLMILGLSLFAQTTLEWSGCEIVQSVCMGELRNEFIKDNPEYQINCIGNGDIIGIREAISGITDFGGSCRHKLDILEERNAKIIPFAWDAIVVIVSKDNPLKNISSEQLKKVLTGDITNWREFGGETKKINLIIRKGKINGVGRITRELLFADPKVEYASDANAMYRSSLPLERAVENDRYAFAVTGIYTARKNRGLKLIKLDNVSATNENIRTGKYSLYRPLYLVANTLGTNEGAQAFIDFTLSDKGQNILKKKGIINLADGKNLWKRFEKKMKKTGQKKKNLK